jgi:hypothetical protein
MSQSSPSPRPNAAAAEATAREEGPLTPDHLLALDAGRRRVRKIRRAASVAALSGWTMVIFGALTLLGVVFGSLVSLVLGGGLIGLGVNELRGGTELRRLDARGGHRLGWNQIMLAIGVAIYAGWKLYGTATGDPLESLGGSTGDANMDATVSGLYTSLSYGLYGGVLVLGTAVPLLTARYYFRRGRLVTEAVAATPPWVVQTLRAAD